jgi:hypothetical protein
MKKNRLIAALVLTTAITGTAVYLMKQSRQKRRLAVVSDAGYETAHDILFPVRYRKI